MDAVNAAQVSLNEDLSTSFQGDTTTTAGQNSVEIPVQNANSNANVLPQIGIPEVESNLREPYARIPTQTTMVNGISNTSAQGRRSQTVSQNMMVRIFP
jgi:hypothetical protein